MFYFFSREFGWSIEEILSCDIFQIEEYSQAANRFNNKSKKRNFKDDYSKIYGSKKQDNSFDQILNSKFAGFNVNDKRKKGK